MENLTFSLLPFNIGVLDNRTLFQIYCINPPPDSCPFGPCPNPDVTGLGQKVSLYITATVFAITLVLDTDDFRYAWYGHIANNYSLLVAAILSIIKRQLTQNDAVFVIIAVASPGTLHLWFLSTIQLIRRKNLPSILSKMNQVEGIMFSILSNCLFLLWLAMFSLILLPSMQSPFRQPACHRKYGMNGIISLLWAPVAVITIMVSVTENVKRIWLGTVHSSSTFKFLVLVIGPSIAWISSSHAANPTVSSNVSFGQIYAMLTSLLSLYSLILILVKRWNIKFARIYAMLTSFTSLSSLILVFINPYLAAFWSAKYHDRWVSTTTMQTQSTSSNLPTPSASIEELPVWGRCIPDCGPGAQACFKEALESWFGALNNEIRARDQGTVPDFGSYVRIRRHTSGCNPCFALIELANFIHVMTTSKLSLSQLRYTLDIDLPDFVFDHPVMQALNQATNNFATWSNDIFSAHVDHVGELCMQSIDTFCANKKLPSWSPEIDDMVARYVRGLENWIVGTLHWSFQSYRYFASEGLEVKRHRVVTLLPLEVTKESSPSWPAKASEVPTALQSLSFSVH
ncbi:terpenoid synthase [Phlegmacium glaucopus]|nr:terpenoid synthase [Phlegmacium glaucopus]